MKKISIILLLLLTGSYRSIADLPWTYTNTGSNHTIIIDTSVHPNVKGTPLSIGDYIGVFFDSGGTLACAGYEMWTGIGAISIAAFGNDLTLPAKDGFIVGEQFHWKIWRHTDGKVFDAVSTYKPVGGIISDTGRYTTNGLSSLRSLTSVELISLTIQVGTNWNIVSLPLQVNDQRRIVLFPTSTSEAFAYSGSYFVSDSLKPGIGYWLRFPAGAAISLSGVALTVDSIPVQVGWNMIGSVSGKVLVSSIGSIPPGMITSKFFGYSNGYNTADTILPGAGYWVKVGQDGTLILSSDSSFVIENRIRISPISALPPPPPNDIGVNTLAELKEYAVAQAYPNPFNPSTTIQYQLPSDSRVTLKIYNLFGQVVATLTDGVVSAGYKSVEWNASTFASGIYFYRLEATSVANPSKTFTSVKKMVLIK
jgi:hypothetical protein